MSCARAGQEAIFTGQQHDNAKWLNGFHTAIMIHLLQKKCIFGAISMCMKKAGLFMALLCALTGAMAQILPGAWIPPGADTTYPRSIIHGNEVASVRTSLAAGVNLDLYSEVYNSAMSAPPLGNGLLDEKRLRSYICKNAAFVLLMGVKPSGTTTVPLNVIEQTYLRTTSRTLLEQINPYVNILSTDSPSNYDNWQWTSKQIIDFATAYDLLRGSGMTDLELALARLSLKNYVGNLYNEATKNSLGTNFFQGAKNNHALMTAGAIGMAAVILSDNNDTVSIYKPVNWINAAMWNIHNVLWWDIKKQSLIGTYAGYAEGTYYFKYGFCNLLPFFRAMGYYMKDTTMTFEYNGINRKIRNPWYDTNYVKIYDWIQAIRMPDGRMPALEDAYTYRCFPELSMVGKAKYNWPVALSQLDAQQYNSFSAQLTSVYDLRANYIAANVPVTGFHDSLFKVMPEAGIAVFRSGWDSAATYFALTGKHGNALASADAHNHADDGSFLMMVNGQVMALDPGYLSYEMRDTVARAAAHNMLLVNGEGTMYGLPGKSNGAECFIEKDFSSVVQNYAELRTAYLRTNINRKVLFVRKKYFLMADHMSSDTAQQFSYLLHGYGLENGDQDNTGIFTDLFANRRATWKRKNSGLFAVSNSDVSTTMNKSTGVHEFIYQTIQNHTYLDVKTAPVKQASYLTCLQPFKNLGTDTLPVASLDIPSAAAYKIVDGNYTDVAVAASSGNTITIPKVTTGLSSDYSTDAKFFWSSENTGNVVDLFMQKGRVLKKGSDTLISAAYPVNVQYVQTGAKTFNGYVGDTGWINFHTGEYTFKFWGSGIWFINYNTATKIASVYFTQPTSIYVELNDQKLGMQELTADQSHMQVYPNPATDVLQFDFDDVVKKGTHVLLYDMAGHAVKDVILEFDSKHLELPVADVSKGLYIARLSDGRGHSAAPVKVLVTQ